MPTPQFSQRISQNVLHFFVHETTCRCMCLFWGWFFFLLFLCYFVSVFYPFTLKNNKALHFLMKIFSLVVFVTLMFVCDCVYKAVSGSQSVHFDVQFSSKYSLCSNLCNVMRHFGFAFALVIKVYNDYKFGNSVFRLQGNIVFLSLKPVQRPTLMWKKLSWTWHKLSWIR